MVKHLVLLTILLLKTNTANSTYCSVQELLDIAEKNAGNIQAAEYFKRSQEDLATQEKYWSNPFFGFNQGGEGSSVGITQTIPFYSKLQKKYNIHSVEADILGTQKQNIALLVKAEVFKLAYQYYGTQVKVGLLQKRLERLASVDRYLAGIVLTSPTKHSQAYIVKDKINLIKRDVIILENNLRQIWNRINIFTDLQEKPNLSARWINAKVSANKGRILTFALENNLNLKEQRQLIEKYEAEVSFAKVEQMPDPLLSVNKFNGVTANGQSYGIGATISIPIVNTNKYKIAGLNSKVRAQEISYHFQKKQLEKLVLNDIYQYDALLEISRTLPPSRIDVAVSRLELANEDFKRGILDFITYIELDSQEYEVIDSVIDTQVGLATIYADLIVKSGNFVMPKYE